MNSLINDLQSTISNQLNKCTRGPTSYKKNYHGRFYCICHTPSVSIVFWGFVTCVFVNLSTKRSETKTRSCSVIVYLLLKRYTYLLIDFFLFFVISDVEIIGLPSETLFVKLYNKLRAFFSGLTSWYYICSIKTIPCN